MKTPKIYIAGKITGLSEPVYTAKFKEAKEQVTERGFEAVSPVDLPHDHDRTWESYMREDLRALLSCVAVYALDNWILSKGATVEVQLAQKVGIPVIYQESPTWARIPETVMQ